MSADYIIEQQEAETRSKNYQERLKDVVPEVIKGNLTRDEAISLAKEQTELLEDYNDELKYHPEFAFFHEKSLYDPNNKQHVAVLKELYEQSDDYTEAELDTK